VTPLGETTVQPRSSVGERAATRLYVTAVMFTIAVGLYFRTIGVFTDRFSFWLDEAVWAQLVSADDWYRHAIRPLAYMALSRLFVSLHDTELPLRMLAYIPGILSLPLLYLVLRRLIVHRAVIVAGLLIVATHPVLIDYSREYKPYALSVAVHLLLVLSTLRYIQEPSGPRLTLAAGLVCLSPLFAIDAVFALPGVLVALLAVASRQPGHRHPAAMGITGVAALVLVTTLYVLVWHTEMRPAIVAHWAEKYGVFYTPGRYAPDYASWLWQRTRALVGWATLWHGHFDVPGETRFVLGAGLATIPLALWSGQALPAIVLTGPILLALAGQLLGWWPWGPFRTNQYLIVYIVLSIVYSVDLLARWLPQRLGSIGATLVAVVVIAVHCPTDLSAHDHKRTTGDSSIKQALEIIREHHRRQETHPEHGGQIPLVVGRHAGPPVAYYTQQHALLAPRFAFMHDAYRIIHVTRWV
jgi:hypothetical protein